MNWSLSLIPLLPLLSATVLFLLGRSMPRGLVAAFGAGSILGSALCVLHIALNYLPAPEPISLHLWQWLAIGDLKIGIAFYIDGLTILMMSIITGVGFLIHLYSTEFMAEDASYSRYFGYMNLFVASMLILVMADNLLLLFLGWEGVGLCSYLLIGFWYRDPATGGAARKAFYVTRVGDAAMALGLFLLFSELGSLQIQQLMDTANGKWQVGDTIPIVATALLLGGAVGKSAQLPLHVWLPDAMAGPTPVSALIHAATMVTAGVYLIARTHDLFLLAPATLSAVALIGVITAVMAAFAAMVQEDIKRILAWSTISQIGYMFLGLGVGAWSAAVFHLMTHAFFKALLFLAAGAVIHCLHHEHSIFRMGGLRTRLPIVFWSFVIGASALSALPFTSGFFSKDAILVAAFNHGESGPWLWFGGVFGALLTAFYSFRLVFVAFFGEAHSEPDKQPGWAMSTPLGVLCLLALFGGWITVPVAGVFPATAETGVSVFIHGIMIALPCIGLLMAYLVYLGRQLSIGRLSDSAMGKRWAAIWLAGWRWDALYHTLWVRPYLALSKLLRNEPIDDIYDSIVLLCRKLHDGLSATQTGKLRWYATGMALGIALLLALGLGGAT